jgi:tetratricopeptide (TPR) repeat protein
MLLKTIIQGRLEFGSQLTYDKLIKMYAYRVESYYKNDVIVKTEEIFKEETLSLEIPRYVKEHFEKSYKNTVDLLTYCASFALSGTIRAWFLDNGEIVHFDHIEPFSEKGAVLSFMKGRSLIREVGKQDEAIALLSNAIEKHDRHAQAYERRAKICFLLQNYSDALRDYNKCIAIDPTLASAYYGRAKVSLIQNKIPEAIEDFDQTIKKSVALETVHWKSRRLKGEAHITMKEWPAAIFELKLFVNRKFKKNDHNLSWRRRALFMYGLACYENENYLEALAALNEASELPELNDGVELDELLRIRGMAKKSSGKSGGIKDLKESTKMGNKKSKAALKEMGN